MAIKKLQNNYTTPEQSKLLLELGVPADSADCYFNTLAKKPYVLTDLYSKTNFLEPQLPCWSGVRLMEIIDICEIDPKDEEYPTTKMIKDKAEMNYIDYLVGTVQKMLHRLDFSKLEE